MSQLLIHLNEQVKGLIGQKMDYSAIHRAIEVRTRPALSLFSGLRYATWNIDYECNKPYARDSIFKLELVTDDDKRIKFNRTGRITSIKFVLINPAFKNMTYVRMIMDLDKIHTEQNIKATKEAIAEHEENLAKAKKHLAELEARL
jgi:hypothetical protein